MNWNPVVNALVEQLLAANEQRARAVDNPRGADYNQAVGKTLAIQKVARELGLGEKVRRELDYFLTEEEQAL